jgi:carbohydrate kinase (thermoresistant glucokinase family)
VSSNIYVVMGVSGAGKSLIGASFARELGVEFVDGDDYHSADNVKRMAEGIPLTDEDRAGWLRSLAARIRDAKESGTGLVVACSALKRSYRDLLREAAPDLRLVFLEGPRALIGRRISDRRGHYMPASLLDSQFAALEEPSPDEYPCVCDASRPPQEILADLLVRASS